MALLALADVLLANELEQSEQKVNLRRQHKLLRDTSDPFNLTEIRFLKLFRLDKISDRYFIEVVEPHILPTQKVWAVPNVLKILVSLHFYGHGSYQLDVGGVYNFGMSQPTVSRCIELVSNIINDHLIATWIKFPINEEVIQNKIELFERRFNFANTLAAIDCIQIAIISPPANHPIYPAAPYYNRKGYHSINTQIICDAELNILNINARFPGSVHDTAIWNTSNIKDHLRSLHINGNLSYHLIGDSGYAIQPWLLVPVLNAEEGSPEALYNDRLAAARNTIERTNGVLKSRFRCLLKHRTLNYDPIKAAKIIYSCAVLHNIALYFNVELPDEEVQNNENFHDNLNDNIIQPILAPDNWINREQQIRNNFINRYFRV